MNGINAFDGAVMAFIQGHLHNAATDVTFPIITYMGEGGLFWLLLSLVFLCVKKTRRQGIFMVCAIACGFVVGELVIKNLVCRPRPFQQFPEYVSLLIPPPSGFSFPSGHSCSSFAAAVVLFAFSKKWGVPALLLAGLIAFSRIFLFVHWPTDVLAGIVLGIASALLMLWAIPKIEEKRRKDEADLDRE